MKVRRYFIGEEFSRYPGPRFRRLGDFSGEEFRDDVLIPLLRENDKVVLHLDGVAGYGSSFFEEAFGGAIRAGVWIDSHNLELVSDDECEKKEVWSYIEDAKRWVVEQAGQKQEVVK